jgi:hypothetical protein
LERRWELERRVTVGEEVGVIVGEEVGVTVGEEV